MLRSILTARMIDNKKILKEAGLKKTEARLALIDLLEKEDNPLDVSTIIDGLKVDGIRIDQATVYRILDILTQKGLINRLEFGEGKYRYELQKSHHHHLICQECGRIEDVEGSFVDELEKEIKTKNGFLVKTHSLEFFGVCRYCQK